MTVSHSMEHVRKRFGVVDGELSLGGLPVTRLAARAGRTPFYAYDRAAIDARIVELRAHLPNIRLHYAMKANPMPAVVGHLAQLVDGIDVASAGEMLVALDTGINAPQISFAGPGKSRAELVQAVAAGVIVNVESFREIEVLSEIARESGMDARVAVRVNPDFELKSSGMKMSGGPKPFGVDAEQVPQLLEHIGRERMKFEGLHIFTGSQNLSADAICDAQRRSFNLAVELATHAPAPIRRLNLGGGFGIPYFPGDMALDLPAIASNLAELSSRSGRELHGSEIVIELGRYIVGEAGIYVCRVIDRKESRGHVFLVTDGGLHHHLAATGHFGQVIRRNYPIAVGNKMDMPPVECVSVVGPLCTPLDLLGDRVELPRAECGDLIVVFQSGAYGATASPQRFLSHPPVFEMLV